jgi:EmrB/QacA subfamily drug resistance transporter
VSTPRKVSSAAQAPPPASQASQHAADAAVENLTSTERRVTLAGLMIVFMLSALDQTIVSTAMPRIATQLHGLSLYAWVTTAYLLSSTVMVPIYGKLSDLYGRKPVLLSGVVIFTIGSALCGLSGQVGVDPASDGGMIQLIVFRGLQGLGGGALMISAFSIIADIFPPRERGRFAGLFGAVFGLASIFGPLLGGFLTQIGTARLGPVAVEGWRLIFYINLPLSLLALFMIIVKMPALTRRSPGSIDWLGAALILVAFIPLLLALSWAGRDYGWGSPRIVGLLVLSALGLAGFIAAEARASHPILPLGLFRNPTFTRANFALMVVSVAFMGVVSFLPLYMQLGLGASPSASGMSMLPLMLGLILASTISGQLVTRTGVFKPVLIGGVCILLLGVFLLLQTRPGTPLWDVSWRVFVMGVGLGPTQSLFNVAIQNSVSPREIGVVTASSQFFRQIGSTVGVAIFGTLLTNGIAVARGPDGRSLSLAELEGLAAVRSASSGAASGTGVVDPTVSHVLSSAMHTLFGAGLLIVVAALLLTLTIPPARLKGRGPQDSHTES